MLIEEFEFDVNNPSETIHYIITIIFFFLSIDNTKYI